MGLGLTKNCLSRWLHFNISFDSSVICNTRISFETRHYHILPLLSFHHLPLHHCLKYCRFSIHFLCWTNSLPSFQVTIRFLFSFLPAASFHHHLCIFPAMFLRTVSSTPDWCRTIPPISSRNPLQAHLYRPVELSDSPLSPIHPASKHHDGKKGHYSKSRSNRASRG